MPVMWFSQDTVKLRKRENLGCCIAVSQNKTFDLRNRLSSNFCIVFWPLLWAFDTTREMNAWRVVVELGIGHTSWFIHWLQASDSDLTWNVHHSAPKNLKNYAVERQGFKMTSSEWGTDGEYDSYCAVWSKIVTSVCLAHSDLLLGYGRHLNGTGDQACWWLGICFVSQVKASSDLSVCRKN